MSDDNNNQLPPSFKPPEHGLRHYQNLPRETTAQRLGEILASITTPDAPSAMARTAPIPVSEPTTQSTSADAVFPTDVANAAVTPTSSGGAAPTSDSDDNLESLRRRTLFSLTFNADIEEGAPMTDPHMLLRMAFKPHVTGLKLTPEQTQLILAYMYEILQEAEIEEQTIIKVEKAVAEES